MLGAPGCSVVVLQNNLNSHTALLSAIEGLCHIWQRKFLHGHKAFLVGTINRSDQLLLQVVAVPPLLLKRTAVAGTIAVVKAHVDAWG